MRLIFVRHGETVANVENTLQGHLDTKLTEQGIDQARKVALKLKDESIDVIYSSDLSRAKDTAIEIAKYHKGIELVLTRELRERSVGVFEGKRMTRDELSKWKVDIEDPEARLEGGETITELYDRVSSFLMKTYAKHKNDRILFVGHGAMGRVLIAIMLNKPIGQFAELPWLGNTSISLFEVSEDKRHKIHLLNDIAHLGKS